MIVSGKTERGYLPAHADAGGGIPPRSCGQTVYANLRRGHFSSALPCFSNLTANSLMHRDLILQFIRCDEKGSLRLRDMMSVDTGTGVRTHTARTRSEMHKQSQTPHGAHIYAALSHTPHARLTHTRTHARTRCAVCTRTHTQTHALAHQNS